jgi:DNA-binding NarL/FixJ family response regulator
MPRVLRVWIVDDCADLRDLYAQLLSAQPRISCRRQFASVQALLAALAEERPPDTILLDVNMPGRDGLSALPDIKKLAPSVKVLMLTTFSNSYYEAEACQLGAAGFLLKTYEIEEIAALVRTAHQDPKDKRLFPTLEFCSPSKMATPKQDRTKTLKPERPRFFSTLYQLCGGKGVRT